MIVIRNTEVFDDGRRRPDSPGRHRRGIVSPDPCIRGFVTTIRKLTGIYNARGTVGGELAYALGKLTGRAHCGLCDITHGLRLRERPEWREQRARLPVPFETVHLDERTPELERSCPAAPCVVADTDDGVVALLGPAELDACGGRPEALVAAVEEAAAARGLSFAVLRGPGP